MQLLHCIPISTNQTNITRLSLLDGDLFLFILFVDLFLHIIIYKIFMMQEGSSRGDPATKYWVGLCWIPKSW